MGDAIEKIVGDWMGAHDVVLREDAHKDLIARVSAAADGARREAVSEIQNLLTDRYGLLEAAAVMQDFADGSEANEALLDQIDSTPPQPDPVAAAREAVFLRAMEWFNAPEYGDEDAKFHLAEACALFTNASKGAYCECGCGGWCNNGATLAALEKGEGL